MTPEARRWFIEQIQAADSNAEIVRYDPETDFITYHDEIRSDESRHRKATPEELVRALALCLLSEPAYGYSRSNLYIEKYFAHGSLGSARDEVDLIIFDDDELPYAMWEFKEPDEYERDAELIVQHQLFGTAPLVGSPRLLVYGTIRPGSNEPLLVVRCIDRSAASSYDHWKEIGSPTSDSFPSSFSSPTYEPFIKGGTKDLRFDCTQSDFRSLAASFHAEFFGEHPDNTLFTNIVKCLLAKIYDERMTPSGNRYKFQVFVQMGREEGAASVFERINELYKLAYSRFIDSHADQPDEINVREFSAERVNVVVRNLESMSLTNGAALHGDIIGAFFEEILRAGFKQDKGMYFTHTNVVDFMLRAIHLEDLAVRTWKSSTHPSNRLPDVIDPACGSGSFLLAGMKLITQAIQSKPHELIVTQDDEEFVSSRMSEQKPNT